ncbi:MAG TPA: hypothetical protein PLA94_03235, partial [Myxococcota bacterium]|nr:hypothetical protein [Myxococcota bacterium]
GRPDAVGTYGSVVDAWRDGDGLVLATRYDGFLRFTPPDRTTEREVAPATGGYLSDLLAADGLVAIVDYTPYRLGEGGLEAVVRAPIGDLDDAWDTDGAGHLRRTTTDSNSVTTTVWADPVTSAVEEVYDASDVLRDGLGALYVDAPRAGTRRQVDGRWTPIELPVGDAYLFAWRGIPGVSGLFRRHRGGPDAVAVVRGDRLTPLPGTLDATAWDGAVALLTTSGLVRWDPASDRRSPIPFPLPEQPLRVTQDGCGRLWVAGRTLVTPDMAVSIPGLDGRAWTAMVGLPDGVGLTDGAVIAELRRACR